MQSALKSNKGPVNLVPGIRRSLNFVSAKKSQKCESSVKDMHTGLDLFLSIKKSVLLH